MADKKKLSNREIERRARESLKDYDVHVTKKGGASTEDNPVSSKSTSLRNLRDSINTFRKGR